MTDNNEKPTEQKYPKSIAFIISNEFCERFNYYGMRTILALYMTIKLGYTDDAATILFHVFTSLVYLFPILGAIVADSYLGKFRTILYLSIVYACGSLLITIGAIPVLNLPATTLTVAGLMLIGLGSGGIKPCVAAFGGDQFKIPEQAAQLATFFSFFYFAINAGSLISTYLMPIFREDVHCFGDLDCFSLAFGIPGVLMVVSIIIFVAGKSMYIVKDPKGNVIVQVTKCIINAITEKSKQTQNQLAHWLDYAEPAFGQQMVSDVKSVFKILLLFVPLPLFWALFDQQGSRWTFQATRMVGDIGFGEIKPDQMQVLNPLLILVFIPLFDCSIYPLLAKIGLKRPLQKMAAGGYLAAVAFFISGIVETQLESTYPVFPKPDESQIRIYNGNLCNYTFSVDSTVYDLNPMQMKVFNMKSDQVTNKAFMFLTKASECKSLATDLTLSSGHSNSFFLTGDSNSPRIQNFEEKIDKSKNGYPSLRVLSNFNTVKDIKLVNNKTGELKSIKSSSIDQFDLIPAAYTVFVDDQRVEDVKLMLGGVYTMIISESNQLSLHVVTPANNVNMLWLIPQFVLMTAGEVMFSVTGLEFAYSQAPATMKSLLQACWLLTVAFGNVIVVVIAEAKFFNSQAYEFFLFAFLMIIDMGIFGILAMRYKYVINNKKNDDLENSMALENTTKTFTNDAFTEE